MAVNQQHICAELVPIFNHLDQASLVKISAITQHQKIAKGEQIISPLGERRLVILARGSVKVYQLAASGKEQLLRIMEPGDFEGEKVLFDVTDDNLYGEALSDSEVCLLRRDAFQQLLMTYPEISLSLLEDAAHKMARLEKQTNLINSESVEARLVSYLLDLQKVSGENEIVIPMKLKELAAFLGTTPETLSRKLKDLTQAHLISRVGRRITLEKREQLEDFY